MTLQRTWHGQNLFLLLKQRYRVAICWIQQGMLNWELWMSLSESKPSPNLSRYKTTVVNKYPRSWFDGCRFCSWNWIWRGRWAGLQYFLNPTVAHEPVPEQLELIANELLSPLHGIFHHLVQQVRLSKLNTKGATGPPSHFSRLKKKKKNY